MDRIRLRPARQEDAAALQRLNADVLGYDYSLSDTQEQLHRLLAMPQHLIVVAEAEGKQELVGYVHAQDYEVLYSSPMKDILGIAVHPDYQHQGIGSSLLAWIEQWASSQDACMIRLVSSEARIKAHAFYEANGYLREKRQLNFKKMI
ncbi:GNAT family N-acetyltransferase [[Clostridium] innocuum]|uniref:GNAT family N-acetyltransferase n=1 Tax=Clostridium innocuum TaxID=1522 RepID=UPI00216B42F2|nr:GNAT family N-acetyltransferase [[Clostridium] innocuum]